MASLGQKFDICQNLYKGWWKGLAKPILAYCPMCEREHTVTIWWMGRGQPRLYCNDCILMMRRRDSDGGLEACRDSYKY